jgi:hypothetical protein
MAERRSNDETQKTPCAHRAQNSETVAPPIADHAERICIIDPPGYAIVGDSAIFLGEMAFLRRNFPEARSDFFDAANYTPRLRRPHPGLVRRPAAGRTGWRILRKAGLASIEDDLDPVAHQLLDFAFRTLGPIHQYP